MPAAAMAAAFEHVEKAGEVGVGIGIRLGERVAKSRLNGEIRPRRDTLARKQRRDAGAVGKIELLEFERTERGEPVEPRLLEFGIVIGVEIVDAHDAAALLGKPPRQMKADEAG